MASIIGGSIKRLFWYIFAGMRGGPTRLKLIKLILDRPFNTNQLKVEMGLDYKTIQHHIRVLEENRLIVSEEKKYGTMYFPSQILEQNIELFKEICEKLKED